MSRRNVLTQRAGAWQLPIAIFAVVLMVNLLPAAQTISAPTQQSTASAGGPPCLPGGCQCTYEADTISSVVVTANATNVTLRWHEAYNAPTVIDWGNTTAKDFSQDIPSGTNVVFLDFLQPSRTYYYEIFANPTGQVCLGGGMIIYTQGTYSSSLSTGADTYGVQVGGSNTIAGRITDANGTVASVVLDVWVTCNDTPYYTYEESTDFTTSGANGWFTANFPSYLDYCPKGVQVEVLNHLTSFDNSQVWPGVWNETLRAFAPQAMNVVLPMNVISPYVTQIADFSNANSSNGMAGLSSLSLETGTTFTNTASFCWDVLYFDNGCSTNQTTIGSGRGFTSNNGNLEVAQRYKVSGTVYFSPVTRVWNITGEQFVSAYGLPQFPAADSIADYLTPTSDYPGAYLLSDWGGSGSNYQGVKALPGYPQWGSVTISSTTGSGSWQNLEISVDFGYDGVGGGVSAISAEWTQTSSTTNQESLQWTLGNATYSSNPATCFVVYGLGGSAAANTADIVGVYAYPVNSQGACPDPT